MVRRRVSNPAENHPRTEACADQIFRYCTGTRLRPNIICQPFQCCQLWNIPLSLSSFSLSIFLFLSVFLSFSIRSFRSPVCAYFSLSLPPFFFSSFFSFSLCFSVYISFLFFQFDFFLLILAVSVTFLLSVFFFFLVLFLPTFLSIFLSSSFNSISLLLALCACLSLAFALFLSVSFLLSLSFSFCLSLSALLLLSFCFSSSFSLSFHVSVAPFSLRIFVSGFDKIRLNERCCSIRL